MKRNVTIKQIAQLAGVSPTTVSFVLNNRKGVGDETRKHVLDVIQREQFIPNINSRRLSMKRSFNIAVLFNNGLNYDDLFITRTLTAISEAASKLGYAIVILPWSESDSSLLTTSVNQGNIDGIIIFWDIDLSLFFSFEQMGIPVVSIDSHNLSRPYPKIYVDYTLATYTAVNYLIQQGHEKIAFLGSEQYPELYLSCLNGYKKAMAEASLPLHPLWMDKMIWHQTHPGDVMETILRCDDRPTAFFCVNDILSIGAMRRAIQLGFNIPEDLSFISIDDIFISEFYDPALTTIHIDMESMGRKAVEVLNSILLGEDVELAYCMESTKLVVRNSVAQISK